MIEDYNHREIAELLNINESTVRNQYRRGKDKLLQLIKNAKKRMKLKDYIQENKYFFEEKMLDKSDLVFEKLLKEKLHQPQKGKILI